MERLPDIVLVGAPNCGKSTLFNRLTHSRVPVGNRAGVTVSGTSCRVSGRRIGRGLSDIILTDLPGIRSTEPSGDDERVSCEYLESGRASVIVNVLSATTLSRCLSLTLELRERYPGVPFICVLNMCDELRADGLSIDTAYLSRELGVPFIPISAARGEGIDELWGQIWRTVRLAAASDGRFATVHFAMPRGAEHAPPPEDYHPRGMADRTAEAVRLAAAALRGKGRPHKLAERVDRAVLSRRVGIPLLALVMATVLWITYGPPGQLLTKGAEYVGVCAVNLLIDLACGWNGAPIMLRSILDGCLGGGFMAVVGFAPRIFILFFLLGLIEDSGYMARAAFVMDSPLRRVGLSGRAFVPLLLGLGCTVPAVLATRTQSDRGERLRTASFLPLISCSARTPLYALIAAVYFQSCGWLLIGGIYIIGALCFVALCGLTRHIEGDSVPLFVAELPRYRCPRLRVALTLAAEHSWEFLRRAGSVILLSSAGIWLLSTVDCRMRITTDMNSSLLATLAGWITPLFAPLGLADWRAVAALIAGIGAKEGSVSALGVLLGGELTKSLPTSGIFNTASATAFAIFSSMYCPCVASIAAIRRETGSVRRTAAGMAVMLVTAYAVAFTAYRLLGALS